jgi:hypothetical protein
LDLDIAGCYYLVLDSKEYSALSFFVVGTIKE